MIRMDPKYLTSTLDSHFILVSSIDINVLSIRFILNKLLKT